MVLPIPLDLFFHFLGPLGLSPPATLLLCDLLALPYLLSGVCCFLLPHPPSDLAHYRLYLEILSLGRVATEFSVWACGFHSTHGQEINWT